MAPTPDHLQPHHEPQSEPAKTIEWPDIPSIPELAPRASLLSREIAKLANQKLTDGWSRNDVDSYLLRIKALAGLILNRSFSSFPKCAFVEDTLELLGLLNLTDEVQPTYYQVTDSESSYEVVFRSNTNLELVRQLFNRVINEVAEFVESEHNFYYDLLLIMSNNNFVGYNLLIPGGKKLIAKFPELKGFISEKKLEERTQYIYQFTDSSTKFARSLLDKYIPGINPDQTIINIQPPNPDLHFSFEDDETDD